MLSRNAPRQKPPSVPKMKEKLRVLTVKNANLRILSPAFLARIGPGWLPVRGQVGWMMGARRSGHIWWSG